MLNFEVERISLQKLEYEMDRTDFPVDYNFSEIGYCGHPNCHYANIQFKQATNLILSNFQEKDHPFIRDTQKNKKTLLVSLYFVYRPNKKSCRTDITNDDQNAYTFAPKYGDGSTAYHSHMISVVVFSYSDMIKIVLVISQLQIWVALMIIRMLHYLPKQ